MPNDPDYTNGDQWQLNGTWGINAPAAWSVTTGSDQVIVADVDTGLNYNHPDIYDNVWLNQPEIPASVIGNLTDVNSDGVITFTDLNNAVNQGPGKIEDTNGDGIITGSGRARLDERRRLGESRLRHQDGDTANPDDLIGWNFVNNTNNPMDDEGHGTFTAGEIGEMTNNAIGGAGAGLERADHAGGVPRLLGQRHRHRGRRGDRLRGQPRRQGHQRELGCGPGRIPRSKPRSSTPTSTG